MAIVSQIQPTQKIAHPPMIVMRRPMKSAKSPPMIAPKKVPAERMEVTKD